MFFLKKPPIGGFYVKVKPLEVLFSFTVLFIQKGVNHAKKQPEKLGCYIVSHCHI